MSKYGWIIGVLLFAQPLRAQDGDYKLLANIATADPQISPDIAASGYPITPLPPNSTTYTFTDKQAERAGFKVGLEGASYQDPGTGNWCLMVNSALRNNHLRMAAVIDHEGGHARSPRPTGPDKGPNGLPNDPAHCAHGQIYEKQANDLCQWVCDNWGSLDDKKKKFYCKTFCEFKAQAEGYGKSCAHDPAAGNQPIIVPDCPKCPCD